MPEEKVQDTEEESSALAAEEETQEETAVADDTEQTEELGFNKTQLHQIMSGLGRIVKNQFEELNPPAQEQHGEPSQHQGIMEKFSSDIQEEIFTDPVSAIRKVVGVLDSAKKNLTSSQTVATDKAITAFSEDPYYKDCFTDAQKIARKSVAEGLPPVAAAKLGFLEAKANHLDSRQAPPDMISSGKQIKTTKQPIVPAQFKAQMDKDIEKGLFENEADWIAGLAPKVRLKYSI